VAAVLGLIGDLQRDLRGLSPTPPNKKKSLFYVVKKLPLTEVHCVTYSDSTSSSRNWLSLCRYYKMSDDGWGETHDFLYTTRVW
jgi:hypothetical protein